MEKSVKQILLVEDDNSIRKILSQKLTGEGFKIIESQTGDEGLSLALKNHPDLVILNLRLPKIEGLEVMRRLRRDRWGKAVPIVILTVLEVNEEILAEINTQQPSYYFVKSAWKIEDVIQKIKELLTAS